MKCRVRERLIGIAALLTTCAVAHAQLPAAEMAWALHSEPRTMDPAKVDDQSSEMVRYLTGGVLVRVNRQTQQPEPGLAERYDLSPDGRTVTFHLRKQLRFSDDSALTATDVVATLRRILTPSTEAPVADEFVQPQAVAVDSTDALTVRVHLAKRLVSLPHIFDEIAIEPAAHPGDSTVTSGPFHVVSVKRGEYLLLQRNAFYWRKDSAGHALPYLSSIRLDVVPNREMERMRYLSGQYQLIDGIAPDDFDGMARQAKGVRDIGASLNTEQMWFNQSAKSPLPAYEKTWFTNVAFRQAVSLAIRRADLARIAYKGHATPAYGFVSPANHAWYTTVTMPQDTHRALALLQAAGFRLNGRQLFDNSGHAVRFSIVTNAGNKAREMMAVLIEQDLSALGMQVNVVKLDFPSLIERLMHSQDYEAAILGLTNVDPDPNAMRNVWLSSSPNHQWNPSQLKPGTPWEAEIDQLIERQSTSQDLQERKHCMDRLQQIIAEQQPFIYLVHPNLLYAVSATVQGAQLSALQPGIVSAIDTMRTVQVGR